MCLVDAGVDHADLHPLARGLEILTPEGGSADLLRAPVELWCVASGVEDVPHPREVAEPRQLCAREHDREAVGHEPVLPANARGGKAGRELAPERSLLRGDTSLRSRGMGERGRGEGDDDLGSPDLATTCCKLRPRRALDPAKRENGEDQREGRAESCHRRMRRPEARIGRPRGCGGIGRRARFRSVCP